MKYLLLILLCTGCMTQKKAEKWYDSHKKELAIKCVEEFPLDTITKYDTAYLRAENEDYTPQIDTIYKVVMQAPEVVYDSNCVEEYTKLLRRQKTEITLLKEKYKPCKPDTIRIETVRTIEDKRKLFIAEENLAEEKKDHKKTGWWKDFWMWIAIGLAIVLGIKIVSSKLKIF